MGEYDDLIYLPHPVSRKHPPMSAMDRAAQFSPFSALTGYEAVLQEAGRLTDSRAELTEYSRDILDQSRRHWCGGRGTSFLCRAQTHTDAYSRC